MPSLAPVAYERPGPAGPAARGFEVQRFRRSRSRRRWPPFGCWLLASTLVLAIAQRTRRGSGIHINGPVADSVINEDAAARLATRLTTLDVAEPVTDDELANAWRALRDRARSGKAGEVAALFAVAEQQRE